MEVCYLSAFNSSYLGDELAHACVSLPLLFPYALTQNSWLIPGHTPATRLGLSVFVFSREEEIGLISSEGKKRGRERERDGGEERPCSQVAGGRRHGASEREIRQEISDRRKGGWQRKNKVKREI